MKLVFEGRIDPAAIVTEDGGMAKFYELEGAADTAADGLFVQIHSWSENPPYDHRQFAALVGKRVRVTIAVLDK